MKYPPILNALTAGLAVALLAMSHAASGSGHEREWEDDDRSYDRARRAVERGEALPIAQLLEYLQASVPGEVVGIGFEREHDRWVYEFRVLDAYGRLLEVYVDARTGAILSMEDD